MTNVKKFYWALIFVTFVAITLVVRFNFWESYDLANRSSGDVTLRLPVDIWPGNFWIIVADKKGYFAQNHLDVSLVDVSAGFTDSVEDFYEGKLDAQVVSLYDLVEGALSGHDLVAVLQTDSSLTAEGIVVKGELADFREIRGKRIGVEKGSYLEFYLDYILSYFDIPPDEIIKVDRLTDDLLDAFNSGEIDAAIAWQPVLGDMLAAGGTLIVPARDIPGLSPTVLVFKESFVLKQPHAVLSVLKSWKDATKLYKDNPDEFIKIVSEYAFQGNAKKYSPDEIRSLIETDEILDLEDNLKIFSFFAGIDSIYGQLNNITRFYQNEFFTASDLDINSMIDPRFIHQLDAL